MSGGSRFTSAWESPGFLLWHATLRWQRSIALTLAPLDLTHVQFVLLTSVWFLNSQGERPSQREVADHAGIDPMMTSQVARALVAKDLLRRDPEPNDSRAFRLRVTPSGLRLTKRAVSLVEAADEAFFAVAPGPERLLAVLSALAGRSSADRVRSKLPA